MKPLILIVEDERVIARYLEHKLASAGYATEIADNAAAALVCVEDRRPALILMDIRTRGEDGIAAALEIRRVSDVPIIFTTAYSDFGTRARAQAVPGSLFVTKPYQADFLGAIERMIGTAV